MRDLINQIAQTYRSARVARQDAEALLVGAQEADSKKPVWIQIMRGLLGNDPKIAARFRSLAMAIRQLNHPNIAEVREVGEKGGLPYIVVRALEKAQPLAARLDQPWAVDAAADVVMQAGDALEHAYRKGVLHGSLSPDNLWVEDDGRVRVTGLGVRQILELLQVRLQQADTPYVAPERRGGGPADARTDVYSLAAILYSLLSKRPPVIIQGKVLPVSRFNPDVPAQMDEVLAKGLSQEAAERYADVRAFVTALGAVVLIPAAREVLEGRLPRKCPKCGTTNPVGKYCTKCGEPLPQGGPAMPAQAAPGAVIPPGAPEGAPPAPGPISVAGSAMASQFPAPLPMPQIDLAGVWARLAEETRQAMPEPPAMPVIDWAEVAPPMPKIKPVEG